MEILDLYNFDGEKTGKTLVRGSRQLNEGEYIRAIAIWLKSEGKFLIQKGSIEKKKLIATTTGCVTSGKTPREQVFTECREELNLELDPEKLQYLGDIRFHDFFLSTFIYIDEELINYPFQLQECEVDSVNWLTPQEVESLITEGKLREGSQRSYERYIKPRFVTPTPKVEYIDIYNHDGSKTGESIVRGEDIPEGKYIMIVSIWLKCRDRYLIQYTSPAKNSTYALTGGTVTTGSEPDSQIVTEVYEELGIELDKSKVIKLGEKHFRNLILSNYLYEDDSLDTLELKLQKEEVESVSWLTLEEIEGLIVQDKLRKSSQFAYENFLKK